MQHTFELQHVAPLVLSFAGSLTWSHVALAGVFFYNASRGNLTALSSLTFLTPMFAALGGYFVLGETLTPLQLTGVGSRLLLLLGPCSLDT